MRAVCHGVFVQKNTGMGFYEVEFCGCRLLALSFELRVVSFEFFGGDLRVAVFAFF